MVDDDPVFTIGTDRESSVGTDSAGPAAQTLDELGFAGEPHGPVTSSKQEVVSGSLHLEQPMIHGRTPMTVSQMATSDGFPAVSTDRMP